VLNVAGNVIRSIRNFGPYGISSLQELNLKRNQIQNLTGILKITHLKKLSLGNNNIQS
jgi:Leucine-rich repeat (LRR) protein